MLIRIRYLIVALCVLISFFLSGIARARSAYQPQFPINPYELVIAVNALREAYGLSPYRINSILMLTAQNQADFMASTGQVTHSGPGGVTLTQRLLTAGYPLAGDLSLGGFRAENITSVNQNMGAESAIDGWMGDALHQNTMLSPDLMEIGAGVAMANGRVYLVIDAARPTNANDLLFAATSIVESETGIPAGEAPMWPVTMSTPNTDGQVVHEVQYGQTLWQLAITYGVKIDDIKRLNGLFDNSIYPGIKLLIKIEPTPTAALATATLIPVTTDAPIATQTPTPLLSSTATAMGTPTPIVNFTLATAVRQTQPGRDKTIWVVALIVLAMIGAGIFASLGSGNDSARDG